MKKDRTKIMFAKELEKMLKEMPLDKVRVSKLCERCDTTTPTFYYYFHDKYELVAWIFLHDYSMELGDTVTEYTPEVLNKMNSRLENRRQFYKRAFNDNSQNSIEKYTQAFNIMIANDAVIHATGGEPMTIEQMTEVKYHNYGVLGLFKEWLFGEGDITSQEMSEFLFTKTPDFLKKAYSLYPYSADNILSQTGKQAK